MSSQRLPSIAASYSNLHPLKYEQHWRENIVDILQGMRRVIPKIDIDVAEAEYVELLRCEHLLKDLFPARYIALKRSRLESNTDPTHPSEYLKGVLYHIIQNAKETNLSYKIPAALNELVSLKRSQSELEQQQINDQDKEKSKEKSQVNTYSEQKERSHVNTNNNERNISKPVPKENKKSRVSNEVSKTEKKTQDEAKEKDWTMVPFEDYLKLKSTIDFQRSKIAELTNRLAHSMSLQQKEETTFISEPEDDDRPTRLAERFAIVYEEEWNDAFDSILSTLQWGEMDTIFQLLRIVRYIYDYCETTAKDQLNQLENVLLGPMLHPKRLHKVDPSEFQYLPDGQQLLLSSCSKRCSKEFRKVAAIVSVPELCEDFKNQVIRQIFKWDPEFLPAAVLGYIDKCMEIIWLMCIQEPPMLITWANDGETVNTNYYTFYSRKGEIVRQPVWPAVFLHHGGPLLTRGVVVPV